MVIGGDGDGDGKKWCKLLTVYDWRTGGREGGGRAKDSRVVIRSTRKAGQQRVVLLYVCVCVCVAWIVRGWVV